jgi:hypothetical protein
MKATRLFPFWISLAALVLATLACGLPGSTSQVKLPDAPVASITISSDLTGIDLCQAIPAADFEAVLGRKLVGAPERFDYYGTAGASGCMFDAGKDAAKTAYYGYVVLTPVTEYDNQPLYLNVEVSGLGDEAYFNNGADVRQLWVRLNGKVAFVVGIGDLANEAGARAIAQLVLAAIK